MKIPPGYRLLVDGEIASEGDYCAHVSFLDRDNTDINNWEEVAGIMGREISGGYANYGEGRGYYVIRKGSPPPVEEKVWLNPWD